MLQALAGHDPRDPASANAPDPGLHRAARQRHQGPARSASSTISTRPITRSATAPSAASPRRSTTLRDLGAEIREVQLSPLQDWHACGSLISIIERAAAYEEWARTRLGDFGERMRSRLMLGAFVSGVDYRPGGAAAARVARRVAGGDGGARCRADRGPPGRGAEDRRACRNGTCSQQPSFTMPFNVAGYPAISVCSGFGAGGLPVAIQLVGKPFQEATVLRIADAFEKATPFRDRRPGIA